MGKLLKKYNKNKKKRVILKHRQRELEIEVYTKKQKDLEKERAKLQLKAKLLKDEMNEYKRLKSHRIQSVYVYIQFKSWHGKHKFLHGMKVNACKRCWCWLCSNDRCALCCRGQFKSISHKYIGGEWPKQVRAVDPSLILWKNLGVGKIERFVRALFVYLLSLLIILIGFISTLQMLRYSEQVYTYSEQCRDTSYTYQDAKEVYLSDSQDLSGIVECFCQTQYFVIFDQAGDLTFDGGKTFPCRDWIRANTIGKLLSYGVPLFISVLSWVMKRIISWLSEKEGAHSVTDQLASSTTKQWIIEFINTALVLTVINSRFPTNSFLGQMQQLPLANVSIGSGHSIFTADWYGHVGLAIAASCFYQVFSPAVAWSFWAMKEAKKCWDRGLTTDHRKTRKVTQEAYEEVYIGSRLKIDQRFAGIIATFFIVTLYSVAIPMLYVAGALTCVAQYWSDKILFLKHYRLPPRSGRYLAKRAVKVMEFAVLLHMLAGVIILSDTDIFQGIVNPNRSEALFAFTQTVVYPLVYIGSLDEDRFKTDHAVLYVCGLACFLLCFLLERTFGICKMLVDWCCCMENDETEDIVCTDIFGELSLEDQWHEFLQVEQEIQKTVRKLDKEMRMSPDGGDKFQVSDTFALNRYYLEEMILKQNEMKLHLLSTMKKAFKQAGVKGVLGEDVDFHLETNKVFESIVRYKKDRSIEDKHKMTGLYSYNWLDHPDYINAKKIEMKLIKSKAKRRESIKRLMQKSIQSKQSKSSCVSRDHEAPNTFNGIKTQKL